MFIIYYFSLFTFSFAADAYTVPYHHADGNQRQDASTNPLQISHTLVDDPAEERRGKVESATFETSGNVGSLVASLLEHRVGSLRKGRSHVGNKVETYSQRYQSDDKGLHHITLGKWQYYGEQVEHTSQRSQGQELVARQYDGKAEGYRDEQQRHNQRSRMADDYGR